MSTVTEMLLKELVRYIDIATLEGIAVRDLRMNKAEIANIRFDNSTSAERQVREILRKWSWRNEPSTMDVATLAYEHSCIPEDVLQKILQLNSSQMAHLHDNFERIYCQNKKRRLNDDSKLEKDLPCHAHFFIEHASFWKDYINISKVLFKLCAEEVISFNTYEKLMKAVDINSEYTFAVISEGFALQWKEFISAVGYVHSPNIAKIISDGLESFQETSKCDVVNQLSATMSLNTDQKKRKPAFAMAIAEL